MYLIKINYFFTVTIIIFMIIKSTICNDGNSTDKTVSLGETSDCTHQTKAIPIQDNTVSLDETQCRTDMKRKCIDSSLGYQMRAVKKQKQKYTYDCGVQMIKVQIPYHSDKSSNKCIGYVIENFQESDFYTMATEGVNGRHFDKPYVKLYYNYMYQTIMKYISTIELVLPFNFCWGHCRIGKNLMKMEEKDAYKKLEIDASIDYIIDACTIEIHSELQIVKNMGITPVSAVKETTIKPSPSKKVKDAPFDDIYKKTILDAVYLNYISKSFISDSYSSNFYMEIIRVIQRRFPIASKIIDSAHRYCKSDLFTNEAKNLEVQNPENETGFSNPIN